MMYNDTQICINLFRYCIKGKIKILYYQQYTIRWNFAYKNRFDENFNKTMRNKKKIVVLISTIENGIIVYYIICE